MGDISHLAWEAIILTLATTWNEREAIGGRFLCRGVEYIFATLGMLE